MKTTVNKYINKHISFKKSINFLSVVALLSMISCGGGTENESLDAELPADSIASAANVSGDVLNDLIQSIPSPVEMATVIKVSGGEYNERILNNTDNVDKYNNSYKQAFNIGIYSADLGYINIYEKTMSTMSYVSAIKTLADQIKVGQFFDFATLKNLASNSKNSDSLLYISMSSFNKMDSYLREQKRGELSVLIITGAWLEGLHIASEVAKVKASDDIVEKIGEQKIVLNNLLLIVNLYNKIPYFANVAAELEKLKALYDQVTITYEYAEPETKEVNGQLVIVDNSTSKINMTEAQLKKIIETTTAIRTQLVH